VFLVIINLSTSTEYLKTKSLLSSLYKRESLVPRDLEKRGQGKFWNFWSVAAASAPPLFLQDT